MITKLSFQLIEIFCMLLNLLIQKKGDIIWAEFTASFISGNEELCTGAFHNRCYPLEVCMRFTDVPGLQFKDSMDSASSATISGLVLYV